MEFAYAIALADADVMIEEPCELPIL